MALLESNPFDGFSEELCESAVVGRIQGSEVRAAVFVGVG